MPEPWASEGDVARYLGVAKERSRASWRIPAHRVGRLWRLELPEIDACVEGGGAEAEAAPSTKARMGAMSRGYGSNERQSPRLVCCREARQA